MFVGSSGFPEVVRDFYLSGELSYPTEDLLRTETSSHPSSAFSSTPLELISTTTIVPHVSNQQFHFTPITFAGKNDTLKF